MNLKVLIIEDESIVALHIKKTILFLKHEVVGIVKNCEDALELAKNYKIDLVISDINIEGDLNGIECCAILQHKYNTAVIFVTAYKDIDTLKQASKIDFVGYLVKPFREDELETMVNLAILKYGLLSKKERHFINDTFSYCYDTDTLFMNDDAITLTKKEDKFLKQLMKSNGSVITYDTIEQSVWYGEIIGDSTRRQLVHRFKQKVPSFPLKLVKGVGYKLEV